MNVGIAYPAFFTSFQAIFPEIKKVMPGTAKEYDLIIFSGGEDINPGIYGQPNLYSSFSQERDNIEAGIFREWKNSRSRKAKLIGICRGHQLIHALLGGSLYQDLFYELKKPHRGDHGLEISQRTKITEIFKDGVNSMHHQGVRNRGENLFTTASYNGVPEISESENILTVQFHPEWLGIKEFWDYVKSCVENKEPFLQPIKEETFTYIPNYLKGNTVSGRKLPTLEWLQTPPAVDSSLEEILTFEEANDNDDVEDDDTYSDDGEELDEDGNPIVF